MNQSVENFINELKTRIDLLGMINQSLDSSKIDQIENIIDKYGLIDTQRYNPKDIEYIATVMELPMNDDTLTNYRRLDDEIKNYIEEFNEIRKTNIEFKTKEINMYQKYINLLSNDFTELFKDYDELNELMSNVFTPVSDKWQILSYINSKNIKLKEGSLLAINLSNKISIYNRLYLSNDEVTNMINDYIKDKNLDLDMIPSIATKLSNNTYNVDAVRNALSTIILNELYKDLLNNIDDPENKDNIVSMINDTLLYIDNYEENIINPSINLIIKYEDLLNEELEKGNNINNYMNISIEDLEKTVDHEKALMLKELPIVKRIKETMDNINNTNSSKEEYVDYIKLLSSLNDAYLELKEL
jgi:hypothetical protein